MSEFQTALDIVQSTLRDLRDMGVELRASTESLDRLAHTRTAAPVISEKASVAAPMAGRG